MPFDPDIPQAGQPINRVVRDSDLAFADPHLRMLIKLYGDIQQRDMLVVTEDDQLGLWRSRVVGRVATLLIAVPLVALIVLPLSLPTLPVGLALEAGVLLTLRQSRLPQP